MCPEAKTRGGGGFLKSFRILSFVFQAGSVPKKKTRLDDEVSDDSDLNDDNEASGVDGSVLSDDDQ